MRKMIGLITFSRFNVKMVYFEIQQYKMKSQKQKCGGYLHLLPHVLMALNAFGVTAKKRLSFIEKYKDERYFKEFLESRNFEDKAANTSNELQNIGVALQYARDFLEPIKAKHSGISYADLWILASVVAIEEMGGPVIPVSYCIFYIYDIWIIIVII